MKEDCSDPLSFSFPPISSAVDHAHSRLKALNQELKRTLDHHQDHASLLPVHAAATNLFHFIKDNHFLLASQEISNLTQVTDLLASTKKKPHSEALKTYQTIINLLLDQS